MWRPKNWRNPWDDFGDLSEDQTAYEAGADAMLKALRALPENCKLKSIKKRCPELCPKGSEGYGWLIHIPDELV